MFRYSGTDASKSRKNGGIRSNDKEVFFLAGSSRNSQSSGKVLYLDIFSFFMLVGTLGVAGVTTGKRI